VTIILVCIVFVLFLFMLRFSKGKEGGGNIKNKKKIVVLPIYENVLNNVISHVLAHSSPAAFRHFFFNKN